MPPRHRLPTRTLAAASATILAAGCTTTAVPEPKPPTTSTATSAARAAPTASAARASTAEVSSRAATTPALAPTRPSGRFTIGFAGDVHFAGRISQRLDNDPSTVFAGAATVLRKPDLTMVNLETAVTTGGQQQNKLFTFRAPPKSLLALRDAGIDVATMANNHGADYGQTGLRDSLAAKAKYHFPIVGIGEDAAHAYAPYTTTLNGIRLAIIGADQVQDETTLSLFSAGTHRRGVANAYSPRLLSEVRAAKARGYVVVVYVHWGVEYDTCPSGDQEELASALAHAGASAVIGTHAHVLQGAGWLPGGTYVAYGLGNYLWWRSFGNNRDDNGVLTLTFEHGRVNDQSFAPAHLDDRGVPVPATGAEYTRIHDEWTNARNCTDLSARPPR